MTDNELRAAILDLHDRRASLNNFDLGRWESLLSNTAYFLKQEQEKRFVKFVDESLEVEGAPV